MDQKKGEVLVILLRCLSCKRYDVYEKVTNYCSYCNTYTFLTSVEVTKEQAALLCGRPKTFWTVINNLLVS
jgi:hypothetical protein